MKTFFESCKKMLDTSKVGILNCVDIDNGLVTVGNGTVSYVCFDESLMGIKATVNAKKLNAAYAACDYSPTVRTTKNYLMVEKGSRKAKLALVEEEYPRIKVTGESLNLDTVQFSKLKILVPFVSTDASRKWACSVLFDGAHAYATNNVIAARLPVVTPRKFALPGSTIVELLRAPGDPVRVTINDTAVRFDFNNGISLQSQLITNEWPDIRQLIDGSACDCPPIPAGMIESVEKLGELCSNMSLPRIYLTETGIRTDEGESFCEDTSFTFPYSKFHTIPLLSMLKVALRCDFSSYPKPCYFKGVDVEGIIVGLR